MKFRHQSRAITLLEMNEKYCSIIQICILSISMHIQNLIEIHKLNHKILNHKILSINKILMSNKGHNSVKNWPKIMCIRCHMDLVYINAYAKFYQNSSICSEDIEEKHIFKSNKGHNSVVYQWIQPICNPKPLLLDINVQAKFDENRPTTTQVRVRKWSTDGRTLKWFGGYKIIPHHFLCGGV